jgi:hypothetical protein
MPRAGCRHKWAAVVAFVLLCCLFRAAPARADERLCDPSFEDCRARLIQLIRAEQAGIDVAFWFMTDGRYTHELIQRFRAGVPVRVLVDPRANSSQPGNADNLAALAAAGIPMRRKSGGGILHWKMMLFAGQNVLQFGGANYSPWAFTPVQPFVNYTDEVIYFAGAPSIVNSFKKRFDDLWTDTSRYANHANVVPPLTRAYPTFARDPELNFVPLQDFGQRSVDRYRQERQQIDAIMFRITDRRHTDTLIDALARGVRVRLYTDSTQYRDAARLWHSWNVDRLWKAGAEIRIDAHAGTMHQKSVLLHGQGLAIFGSSNWTSPSARSQEEHNYFTTRRWIFDWLRNQFDRKWHNRAGVAETRPFAPLPPGRFDYVSPAQDARGLGPSVTLTWSGGPFAHLYDVYFGTEPDPPLHQADLELGPSEQPGRTQRLRIDGLAADTIYYWRVVAKTMAGMETHGPIWSFSTGAARSDPRMSIDGPVHGAALSSSFVVAGWAFDAGHPETTGIDAIHVYVYPSPGSGAAPVFLGAAQYGGARPDVGAAFGARFTNSGFRLHVAHLEPGTYQLVVFGRSSLTRTFNNVRAIVITVQGRPPDPRMAIDAPAAGASVSGSFFVAGWALDLAASQGTGVDVIHVWAHPETPGAAPIFLGAAAYGGRRPDVGAAFGSRFTNAGYGLTAAAPPPGAYQVVVYARSAVTQRFEQARAVRISVR